MQKVGRLFGFMLALWIPTVGAAWSMELPQQIAYWGVFTSDAGGEGVAIKGVEKASPAAKAGLQAGDVVLSINGVPVCSAAEFSAVKNSFPLYQPLGLVVRRGDLKFERKIKISGLKPLHVEAVQSGFVIPGVPRPAKIAVLSALDALDQINVLDQVILDPETGEIATIGHYDPRFNTGPIPYLDLLKTAMSYPKPLFNLNNSQEVDKLLASKPPLGNTLEFVLGHPDLEQDRQRLLLEWSALCGLSPEELVSLYNYVHFAVREAPPPAEIRTIQSRILTNLGYTDVALAYELLQRDLPDSGWKALQILGRDSEAKQILLARGGDMDQAKGELKASAYLAMMEAIHVSAATVTSLRRAYAQGRSSWQEVVTKARATLLPLRSKTDDREIAELALAKIMLSEQGTQAFVDQPLVGRTILEAINLDRTSQLTRIMYEADYSLKSVVVMPHLFRHIPGSLSQLEYLAKKGIEGEGSLSHSFWFEPKQVTMMVSPGRGVVSFGPSLMAYQSRYSPPSGDLPGLGAANSFYDDWCANVMAHYDEYAQVLPAFHSVRELAKVIALANWMIAGKVPVDLSGVQQVVWEAPERVAGFWRSGQAYMKLPNRSDYDSLTIFGYSGGVTFHPKSNWTQVTQFTASETRTTDQLTLSAGLGQRAVQAAQGGDLEQARYLAELSAQAMNGSLSKSKLAAMNLSVPDIKPMPVSPANVHLQKELIKKTQQQIVALGQHPTTGGAANAALTQMNSIYDQVREKPAAASAFLLQLQTSHLPQAAGAKTTEAKPPAATACEDRALGKASLPEERSAYLTTKLGEARNRLRHINEALRRLIDINEAQRAEVDKLTAELSVQYQEAKDRAWDVAFDLLTSVSLDAFAAEQAKRVKGIDDAIQGRIALKMTPLDAGALQKAEEEMKLLASAKFHAGEAYASTERLIDLFKGVKYGKDMDEWRVKNQDLWNRTKSWWALVGNLALDNPALEKWLGRKAFFAGEKLWQVATMGKMAYYAWGFYLDLLTQRAVWEPMAMNLQSGLANNTAAMEHLRQRAEITSREIRCLEDLFVPERNP